MVLKSAYRLEAYGVFNNRKTLIDAFNMSWYDILELVTAREVFLTIQHESWQRAFEQEYTEMNS